MNDVVPSRVAQHNSSAQNVQSGFTIIETLIVLAVTGLLLLMALLAFSGQQARVEFSQSVRDIQSVIQQNINEVGAGYYPNGGNIQCVASGAGIVISPNAGTSQGSNTGCIFLGKVMQFGVKGAGPEQYNVITVAGLQKNTGTITSAKPQAVYLTGSVNSGILSGILRNGLRVASMKYVVSGSATNIGAVAFVSGLGSYNGADLVSGTQQMSLVPVGESGTITLANGTDKETIITKIQDNLGDTAKSPLNPDGGVQICFVSGGNKQSGLITIGGGGRGLSVKLDIRSSLDCT